MNAPPIPKPLLFGTLDRLEQLLRNSTWSLIFPVKNVWLRHLATLDRILFACHGKSCCIISITTQCFSLSNSDALCFYSFTWLWSFLLLQDCCFPVLIAVFLVDDLAPLWLCRLACAASLVPEVWCQFKHRGWTVRKGCCGPSQRLLGAKKL